MLPEDCKRRKKLQTTSYKLQMMESYARKNLVLDKAEAFALRIVNLYRHLQAKHETVISKQVLRSGTSIGANITEGHYAASKVDFTNKYVIARKEAGETLYWLNLLIRSDLLSDDEQSKSLIADCKEILSMLVASIKTARGVNKEDQVEDTAICNL